jgi:phosphatidylserine/phosphatidylglycerophosphate/cardiolipin synthase-like enzyme
MTRHLSLTALLLTAHVLAAPPPAGAAPAPVRAGDALGSYTLVESWPEHTVLDLAAIPDAPDVWTEVFGRAAHRLDVASFYFSRKGDGTDAPGPESAPDRLRPVLAQLEAAAGRGVAVRLLADAKFAKTYPEVPAWAGTLPGAQSRTFDVGKAWGGVLHAKYFLADDDALFIGSQNFDWRALGEIHEMGILVRDRTLAAQARRIYDLDWALAAGEAPAVAADAAAPGAPKQAALADLPAVTLAGPEDQTVRAVLAASPPAGLPDGVPWDLPLLVEMMDAARDSVHVQLLSYGVSDRDGRQFDDLDAALRRAAARGAKVRFILSDWAATKYALPCIKSLSAVPGIEVRFTHIPPHPDGFIPYARVEHAKYLTVDGNAMWVGTSNWSRDYFHESRNLGVFLRGDGATRQADAFFNLSWHGPYAEKVTPEGEYAAPKRN